MSAETEATTQDVVEAPSVSSEKPKKPVEKPVEKPAEKPQDPRLKSALDNFKKSGGSPTGTGSGQGSTTGGGDQGASNGSKNSDGQGGSGIAGYNLSGRKPIATPAPMEGECEGEQIVVVKIYVNKDGRVIQATPGVKGSTTISKNLLDRAQNAAMRTTWQVDPQGRELQMGSITYTFKCS